MFKQPPRGVGSAPEAEIWMKQQTLVTFQSRPCLEEGKEVQEAPRAGNCRPEGRVASPGPYTKVKREYRYDSSHGNDSSHINDHLECWRRKSPNWPSVKNVVYFGTKGRTTLADIGPSG